jgi:hypothetical protein
MNESPIPYEKHPIQTLNKNPIKPREKPITNYTYYIVVLCTESGPGPMAQCGSQPWFNEHTIYSL